MEFWMSFVKGILTAGAFRFHTIALVLLNRCDRSLGVTARKRSSVKAK
jgi:hypothetical protein